jgi:uncharacterized protein (UPF0548 family)
MRTSPAMVLRRPPTTEILQSFLDSQAGLGFTYKAIGATAERPPPGYVVDHTRVRLGRGMETYRRARSALQRWEQFRLGWVHLWPSQPPIRTGEPVVVFARQFGLWWLNACRIVSTFDEADPSPRFGFAYGTLPDHAQSGEERFLVEINPATGEVFYDVLAFSRPRWVVARLGYPHVRRLQKRFGRESAQAMIRAAAESSIASQPGEAGAR